MNRAELLKIAKPILFNTEMVRAILDGRKTVTRRVIKPRYKDDEGGFQVNTNVATGENWVEKMDWDEGSFDEPRYINPPYNTDDILYVRETYAPFTDYTPCGKIINTYAYKADDERYFHGISMDVPVTGWHPSIHMPKDAARIFLKVTNVSVERLQDITCSDMEKEGVIPCTVTGGQWQQWQNDYMKPVWDSTIKKSDLAAYGWNANPWVWVIEFERVM